MEFSPFSVSRHTAGGMWDVAAIFLVLLLIGNIDQLQNQRSSRHNATAPGQEVAAHDVFKDGGLSRGLRTDHNLGITQISVSRGERRKNT